MARPTIDNIRGIKDFATNYRWDMTINFPQALAGLDTEDYNFRCESAEMPLATNTLMEANIRGHKVKQSGILAYQGELTLNFIETVDSKISDLIKAWRDACWKANTGVATSQVALEGSITLQRLDSQDQVVWIYTLFGVFLSTYDPGGQLVGDGGDLIRPTMTISYDYFKDGRTAVT